MKSPAFKTEADLCAAFIAALPVSWTAYAETAGWDILLVRGEDGFQIGVEAKLRLNVEVVNQAIERDTYYTAMPGPDCRAVLVPAGFSGGLTDICRYVGVVVIGMNRAADYFVHKYEPGLPELVRKHAWDVDRDAMTWPEWMPPKRHALPDYVPDVVAGASGPTQLTDWKIRAIKIAVILEIRGYVTREDFKHIGIDHRRWMPSASGWLAPRPGGGGWVAGKYSLGLRGQHPRVFDEIKADAATWMSPKAAEVAT